DFNPAEGDTFDFTGVVGVHKFSDLPITQNGSDTIITLGSGVVLKNFNKDTLTQNQFLFSQPPTDIQLSGTSVAENGAAGTMVGSLSATDDDLGEVFTFSLVDDAGGRFAIAGQNLVVAGTLDYETASSHNVTVRVTDSTGNTFDKTFAIAVDNNVEITFGTNGNDVTDVAPGSGVDFVQTGPGNDLITIEPEVGPV